LQGGGNTELELELCVVKGNVLIGSILIDSRAPSCKFFLYSPDLRLFSSQCFMPAGRVPETVIFHLHILKIRTIA